MIPASQAGHGAARPHYLRVTPDCGRSRWLPLAAERSPAHCSAGKVWHGAGEALVEWCWQRGVTGTMRKEPSLHADSVFDWPSLDEVLGSDTALLVINKKSLVTGFSAMQWDLQPTES